MKSLKKSALAAATAVALGMGITGTAYAGAEAFANLNISNFRLYKSADGSTLGSQFAITDFNTITIQNQADASADLVSVPGSVLNTQTLNNPNSIHLAQAQQGPAPAGPVIGINGAKTPDGTGTFARADADISGTVITIPGFTSPSSSGQVSEVQLTNTDIGSGGTHANNTSGFTFTVAQSGGFMAIDLTAAGSVYVNQTTPSTSGNSQAGFDFAVTVRNLTTGTTILSFNPAELQSVNNQRSIAFLGSDSFTLPSTAYTAFTTAAFVAGDQYQFQIRSATSASADTTVPEPTSLSLLAAGFIGLASARRRNKA